MTRKDFVDRLNQLTIHYNLTWKDVAADADNAIVEINNLLGADFPPLSQYFLHDNSYYAVQSDEERHFIIAPSYFHSVIIPYVAMEVLARDEEFTTVFSKYQADFDRGKATMFMREFNHIPDIYKRKRVEGVFFPSDNRGKQATPRGVFNPYVRSGGSVYPVPAYKNIAKRHKKKG